MAISCFAIVFNIESCLSRDQGCIIQIERTNKVKTSMSKFYCNNNAEAKKKKTNIDTEKEANKEKEERDDGMDKETEQIFSLF